MADAMGHVVSWEYALAVQQERIEGPDDNVWWRARRNLDCRFFVMALMHFLRSVDLVKQRTSPAARALIETAVARFHEEVPGAVKVRHRLEHFDAYEEGTGNEQRKAKVDEPSITWFENATGRHVVSVDVPGVGLAQVEVAAARQAADRLAAEVDQAIG